MKSQKDQSKKIIYVILLLVSLCSIGVCVYLNLLYQQTATDDGEALEERKESIKQFDAVEKDEEAVPEKTDIPENTEVSAEEKASVETLDFEKLREINPEIYAWIEIEGTNIDYPVLQSKDNDKKYLTTAYDGTPFIGGSIFTESKYNGTDFEDPVTVLYGHTMSSGILFGSLQRTYSSQESFLKNSNIRIYLPDKVYDYTVFAAVPYKKVHLLRTYDFSNDYWYNRFFREVGRVRAIGANFNREIFPKAQDRVIILSVCLNEDTAKRYLVMALHNDDLAKNTTDLSDKNTTNAD